MKTRRNKSVLSILLLTITLMMVLAVPASAASKKKLIKSIKEYNQDGSLFCVQNFKYDSRGNLKSREIKYYYEGKLDDSYKYTYKLTYWKGSRYLKKAVVKGKGWTTTWTYNKKGVAKKRVNKSSDGYTSTYTYKSSGRKLKSYVSKSTGDYSSKYYTYKEVYDSHGTVKSTKTYYKGKLEYWDKFKNTYKKGVLRKQVRTEKDGSKATITYNSHGDMTKYVYTYGKEKNTTTYKHKYSGGYLKSTTRYYNNKQEGKTVYTYTGKKYNLSGIAVDFRRSMT